MEQKRTLWIIAAVGIFLLAVLGAALILYSPVHNTDTVVAPFEPDSQVWSTPNTFSQVAKTDVLQEETDQNSIIDNTQDSNDANTVTTLQLSENTGTAPSTLADNQNKTKDLTVYSTNTTVVTSSDGTTTVNLAEPKAVPTTKTENITQKVATTTNTTNQSVVKQQTTSPVEKKPTIKTTSVATNTNKKTVSTTKTISQNSTKLADSYWVQAAAYTNKANADKARDTLLAEEIPAEVFTYTNNGITYYRVRVGAYTTKSEAEYWKKRIQLIDEFSQTQSYVTNSSIPKSK